MDKLNQIILSLTTDELEKLRSYLASPYFSVPKFIQVFGNKYLDWVGDAEEKFLKEKGWEVIYPDRPFDDKFWRKRKSEFKESIDGFLVQLQTDRQSHTAEWERKILHEYFDRGLVSLFKARFSRANKYLELDSILNGEEMIEGIQILDLGYNYWMANQDPNKPSKEEEKLLEAREYLMDTFYLFQKLKTSNALLNRQGMNHDSPAIRFPEEFLSFKTDAVYSVTKLIRIHGKIASFLESKDERDFHLFLDELPSSSKDLGIGELRTIFMYGINIGIRNYYSLPNQIHANQLFEIYKKALDCGVVTNRYGKILPGHFKNICTLAIRQNDFEYCEAIINRFETSLGSLEKGINMVAYCKASLAFSKGDFESCLKIIRSVKVVDNLKIEVRTLEMKTLYELERFDQLDVHLSNFERWLQRSKLASKRLEVQFTRLRVIRRILTLPPGNYAQKRVLQEELMQSTLHDKDWLMEKLAKK